MAVKLTACEPLAVFLYPNAIYAALYPRIVSVMDA